MKITLNSGELAKLRIAGKIVPVKSIVEATGNFLFEVKQTGIKVTATDLYGTIIAKNIETVSRIEEEATFAIPAKLFLQALSVIPNQPIDLTFEDGNLTVEYAQGSFSFPIESTANYPTINPGENPIDIHITPDIFIEGSRQVMNFAGHDELRPVMNGIYIELKDGKLAFVATNALLLATKEYKMEHTTEGSAIVPPNAIKMIVDILKECRKGENISMKITDRHIAVETEDYELVYRLIEGRYPNFRSVIPQIDKVLEVDTHELINVLKRVTIFSSESSLIVLEISENNKIEIFSENIDYRRSIRETMAVDTFFDLKIGLNGTHLSTLLETVRSERCKLSFTDKQRAVVFKPVDDASVTLLQMPMLIEE